MPTLHLHLREGFQDDSVRVTAGGRVVFDRESVSTRLQIGLAVMEEVSVDDGPLPLRVEVRNRGLAAETTLSSPSATPYLLVDLEPPDRIRIVATAESPGYL